MAHIYRRAAATATGVLFATSLVACGSSSSKSTTGTTAASGGGSATTVAGQPSTAGYAPGGTLKVSMGTSPDSLDPQFGYTAQAAEADWLVYTPLLTYAHKSGTAGTTVIPGLATALPVITDGGKTYTLTLRKGLTFSNGAPVVASDFTHAVERAIKISWGGASFFTGNIVGATAYQGGKATTISGITADDATGKITIKLTGPYGAFDNVLAFPAAGLIPATTPMTVLSTAPPPGVGPYEFTSVRNNVSFTLKKTPGFAKFAIPGIPTGEVDGVAVTIQSNTNTEAQDVLDNQSDEFDWSDTLPPAILAQVTSSAKSRYTPETLAGVDYFFMDVKSAPFNNIVARQAVNLAISRIALSRLASGQLTPACYFLPPPIVGNVSGPCSFGSPTATGTPVAVAQAKAMVAKAGLAGTPVTVWSETRQPRQAYCTYLASQLNAIGFKATLKVIADSVYFQTIGSAKTAPQIGFADWFQDFPNPGDFYLLLDARAIHPINSENFGNVDDPHIQSSIISLDNVPASKLASVTPQWQALEKYVSSKDYFAPYGDLVGPFFLSSRVDFAAAEFNPLFGDDWSTFELKR